MRRALVTAALALVPAALDAQAAPAGRCELEIDPTPTTRFRSEAVGAEGNVRNNYIGGTVNARCAGQDVRLRADSAEAYGLTNIVYLIGNVRYTEPRVTIDANRMTYFRTEERLLMEGNVVAVLPSGTTLRGPHADYFRAAAGVRPRSRLVAIGRPTVTLVESDGGRARGEPTRVVANTITMEADSLVYASGSVEITRTDLEARGDSAFLDSGREYARLMRRPVIVGRQRRPFTLRGATIDIFSRNRQLARVLALRSAWAESEDLTLQSDTIDMRLSADSANNTIERVYVWGRSRARATSPERDIVADSIHVVMPGQRLTEVRAIGDAYARTAPDTVRIRTDQRDWMRGDSILARFDTTRVRRPAAADTTDRPRLRDLRAVGQARTWYQVPSEQGDPARPGINYVRGRIVTLAFAEGGVQRVTVVDSASGVFLEPLRDTVAVGAATGATGGSAPARGATTPPARPRSVAPAPRRP